MRDPENSNRKKPLSPLELKGQGEKMKTQQPSGIGVLERHHICLRGALSQSGSKEEIITVLIGFLRSRAQYSYLHTFDLLKTCSQEKKKVESRMRKSLGISSFTLILQRVLEHES